VVVLVRWDRGGTVRAGDFFFVEKETKIINLGTDFFVHHRLVSAVKRVNLVSDRMSYTVLRGHWCNTIILIVHEANEVKVINQNSLYGELQQIFYHFSKYHIKIILGDFNEKFWREDIFKLTIVNESLHQDSNDNGV